MKTCEKEGLAPTNTSVLPTAARRSHALLTTASGTRMPVRRGYNPTAPIHVNARFLPYDDVCRVVLGSSSTTITTSSAVVGNDTTIRRPTESAGKLLQLGRTAMGLQQQQELLSSETITLCTQSRLATASPFLSELQSTLFQTNSKNPGMTLASLRSDDKEENVWMSMFRKWPFRLAASGYAEWWLRHPSCDGDASPLFEHLLNGLSKEEHRRRVPKRGNDTEKPSAECLCGLLCMLRNIYTNPPHSLISKFKDPSSHQQLFFHICRLGAQQDPDTCEGRADGREMVLCLSLAATVAKHIGRTHLTMRDDLIRFLGRVRREWNALLEARPEEEALQTDFELVHALLELALD
ncbi:hypothetical protein LSM04_002960 [Trypanosoma melophagium]|uniref:uncharacterized protein n=1 Tax=Trypanosoma melophagium TaxID=715481 RepID=UPI00351A8EFB|nr:hypothetical protein LSM04_002960 [Trypanosoma melophagium]